MLVKFTPQEVQKCSKFAQEIDTGYYAKRNQFNNAKRIKDQITGKLGEIATHNYFMSKNIELSEPDFNIYGKSKKSWDYDMKNENLNIHVKSQSIHQSTRYGTSWIFENTDRHIFKDYNDNDYVCFVVVDPDKNTAEIKAILSLLDLHKKKMFKLPKLAYLTTKAAVYFDDLTKSFKNELFAK